MVMKSGEPNPPQDLRISSYEGLEARSRFMSRQAAEYDAQARIAKQFESLSDLSEQDVENALRCFAETTGSHLEFWTFINKLRLDGLTITKII